MPAGLASGLHTVFRYVTIEQVRCAGIPDGGGEFCIDDARLYRLIAEVGHLINRLTDQWFLPVRLRQPTDSGRSSIARMPNQVPILALFNLALEKAGLFSFNLPSISYQVKSRYVMMMSRSMKLPETPFFIIMDGVFGWLVDDYAPASTTTTAPILRGATEIPITSDPASLPIRAGDVVLVGKDVEPKSGGFIVTGVATGPPHKILCEPTEFAIPSSGVPVVRYGRVPDDIQRAALLLIRDRVQKIGDIDTAESPGGIGTRLNSESVEGYSYSLSPLKAINGPGGGAWTTGNAEVDDILHQYATPAMYIGTA